MRNYQEEFDDTFNIHDFLDRSFCKFGHIRRIETEYWQDDLYSTRLYIIAKSERYPEKPNDFHCETIMKFGFGSGITDEKCLESKRIANGVHSYIKRHYPLIEIYRATKCSFAWFEN